MSYPNLQRTHAVRLADPAYDAFTPIDPFPSHLFLTVSLFAYLAKHYGLQLRRATQRELDDKPRAGFIYLKTPDGAYAACKIASQHTLHELDAFLHGMSDA